MRACLAAAIVSTTTASYSEAGCERETIAAVVSPDSRWVALIREGVCFAGNVTVSTDTVQLVRREASDTVKLLGSADEPSHENDVLVVDYYGHFENRPILRWLAPQELQVTIPNLSGVGLQKSSYQDVKISIRYEPDDPAARERWRKEHALPN
jgi:hypothetical protein